MGRRKKRPEQSLPPHPQSAWPGPAPPPFLGRGAEIGSEPLAQAFCEGGVVVPGGRKRRKKLFPLWPTHRLPSYPGPHLSPQGPSKQDGGGGRVDGVTTQALAQVQPGRLGEGTLLREGPLKPGGKPQARRQAKPQGKLR